MAISTDTIWDAKGDLAVATGADAASRLAVTTTAGNILLPDSTTSTGIAWNTPWYRAAAPTGALAESFPRAFHKGDHGAFTSGTLRLQAIYLPKDLTITSISFVSGLTALASGSNQWFALYNSALDLLMQTDDDTSIAWAAGTVKTLNLTSTYTTTSAGLYYIGILIVASTMPTIMRLSSTNSNLNNLDPKLNGNSTTGLTGAAPDPAAAISSATTSFHYCYVS